ncbi:MAG: hypothetical protein IT424_10455, partial [Pirellulales bacterium]|nr:hypothetical protein [Pirellulales bacterium]
MTSRSHAMLRAAVVAAALSYAAVRSGAACAAEEGQPSTVTIGGLEWRTDYGAAYAAAKQHKRMLLINFVGAGAQQRGVEQFIECNRNLQAKLGQVERARLPLDAVITVDGKPQRLASFPAFAHLQGGPGFAMIDLCHSGASYYGSTVSALPYASGKYYHWQPSHLSVMLDLPPGTITQRTMVWAVRVHPERPQSTSGVMHPTLASSAASHSAYQASIGVQGHQNFESRYHQLSGAAGGSVSEVVAESWPGQNMIDSCIDCVDSWRHSSGHWRGVSHRHRAFAF